MSKPATQQIDTTDGNKAAEDSKKEESKAETDKKDGDEDKKDDEEDEKEEEDTIETVEETWKSAERFTELLAVQTKELEDVLNKIFHSTNPASRMKDLAENLDLAIGGDS